jgi:FKBP-type peptidyl-prolyl cis-trans isomerase
MRFKLTLTPYLIYFLISVIAISSCKKDLEAERTLNENKSIESYLRSLTYTKVGDIYHVIRKPVFNYQVAKGDTVEFWYVGHTLEGKVFDTNVEDVAVYYKLDLAVRSFDPVRVIAGSGKLIEGLDDGLLLLRDKELATILFSSSLGYGGNAIGPIAQWSPLAFEVEILKVNGPGIENEKSVIESLNLSDFSVDTSGLYLKYIISGPGLVPTINDTIYGWYKGTLPDGTVVDDIGAPNMQIAFSNIEIPEGVRLGFLQTKVGGTTDLVLPSYLGYGNKGNEAILPYQTLFYQIRLDSIKK